MKSNHRFFAFAAAVMMLSGISMPVSAEERTFTVGFDAEFPPTAIRTTAGSMWALTLTWHKRCARETAGSW